MKTKPKFLTIILTATIILTILPTILLVIGQNTEANRLVTHINTIPGLTASIDTDDPNVINVVGWVMSASSTLTLNITEGITLKWAATYFGSSPSSYLINYIGDGTLEIGPGGYICNEGTGAAINAAGAKVVVTGTSVAACGIVEANSGSAIVGTGPNTIVIVEGFGSVFGDERSNLHPVINMNNPSNKGDNVFVKDHGSVWAIADATLGYAIQTYGNVVVDGGDIYSASASGRGINLVGGNSIATINGGKIHVDGGPSSVAISTATTDPTTVPHASVYVNGGTVSATAGYAIRTTGAHSIIQVTGGTVSATTGNAIRTEGGANISIIVSGGFVFAYGTAITGTTNVIHTVNGGTLTTDTGVGVIVAWTRPSTPPAIVYIEGSVTNLVVFSGIATWHNDTVHSGIIYTNGANHGFFPISNVLVTSYNIHYELNGGSLPEGVPTTYYGAVLPLDIPDAFGVYVFDGWSVACANGTVVVVSAGFSILEGTYGDLILTALWDTVVHAYNIVYVLDGGIDNFGNPSLYTVDDLPLVIVDPTRAGYTFLGWLVEYADGRIVGVVRAFSVPEGTVGDIVLIANWLEEVPVVEYTVTYNGNGHTSGTVPIDISSPYLSGRQVTVLGPNSLSRNSYTFLGWATSSTVDTPTYLVDSTFTITDNVVLYAVWEQTVSYSVSYQPGTQGTFDEQITHNLSYGDPTPEAPEVSAVVGWIFTGWSPEPTATVSGNAVYVAQWDPEMLMVWFVDWDGRILKSESVPYGGTASAPTNPYRAGYTFTGWSRGFTNVVVSLTVVAQYRWIDTGVATPTPTAKPSPTATPPVIVSPSPTASVTVSPSPPPSSSPNDESWSFVNLVLSVIGAIFAGLVVIWMLSQKGNAQQILHRNVWIFVAFVLGVVGLVVFFLTSDLSQPMTMLNNWTALIVAIFIVQLVCLTLAFKYKKVV